MKVQLGFMKLQLGGKEYISNLVGLGFKPMHLHFFLINYLHPMQVEVAVPCGGGLSTGVVGPCGRGMGWWAHVLEAVGRGDGGERPAGVGLTTMQTGPDRWDSTTMLTGPHSWGSTTMLTGLDKWSRLPCWLDLTSGT
jgi:hypothetical protein